MALAPGEYRSGGRIWDSTGKPVTKVRAAGSGLVAGDSFSGGKLIDVDGYEVIYVGGSPGEFKSGGRIWDSAGRPVGKNRTPGSPNQAGDFYSGGKLLDANGYEVIYAAAAQAYDELILAHPSLLSLWKLDEASGSFQDAKGAVHSTSDSGVTRQQTGLPGSVSGKGVAFANVNGTIGFGQNHILNIAAWSIECWAKMTSFQDHGGGNTPMIFGRQGFSGTHGWILRGNGSDQFEFRRQSDSGTDSLLASPYTTGNWLHHVVTCDGTNLRYYVNKVLKATDPFDSAALTGGGAGNLAFGRVSGNLGSGAFQGTLAMPAVYSAALDLATIQEHYDKGVAA